MVEFASMENTLYESFHKNTSAQVKLIKNNNFTYRNIVHFINKYSVNKSKALDIGCGAGNISFYIANKGIKVLGIDISAKAVKMCLESSKNLRLDKLTDFKVVNFPKESISGKFDLIIVSEVIEHLSDDKLALSKIFSMLNRGGVAIITTPSINAPLYKLGYAKGFDIRVGHLRRYSIKNLSEMCVKTGFKVVETKKIEGILRNFLFLNPFAGKSVRFIKFFVSDIVTLIDNSLISVFKESNIVVVVRKP
jgi:2-polyprenyl-3-methyl-5-hydroxy-6-metoxy-1,4-benzoquinol methylase